MATPTERIVRFGVFEVDLESGELRRAGRRIALQEQPFCVLARLLERPGQVVTREELRSALWPADTFVDFEQGLNGAVKRLREALGDSAESPRYIETLARRGYRFIAPVAAGAISSARRRVSVPRGISAVLLSAISAAAGIALTSFVLMRPHATVAPAHLTISAPDLTFVGGSVAVSPDGATVAFTARKGGQPPLLFLRRLGEWEFRPLQGTEGATRPFFSPDGRTLGFVYVQGREPVIRTIPVDGGTAQTLIAANPNGVGWAEDGRILFTRESPPAIWSISAAGRDLKPLLPNHATGTGVRYLWPQLLPKGEALLFCINAAGHTSVMVYSLRNRRLVELVRSGIRPRYLAQTGHLVYQSGGSLFAVPFDADRLQIVGDTRVVADHVGDGVRDGAEYDISRTGVFVSLPPYQLTLAWRNRDGTTAPLPFKRRRYDSVALSPDDRKAVLGVQEGTAHRLYIADLTTGEPLTPLTSGDDDWFGLFTGKGDEVLFTSGKEGRYNISSIAADGSRKVRWAIDSSDPEKATSLSPRGSVLLLNHVKKESDILHVDIGRPGSVPAPLVQTPSPELEATFSPDGNWFAYEQGISGQQEIFVQRYPEGVRRRVSAEGGWHPRWNPFGGELFYHSRTGIVAVPIVNGIRRGPSVLLFDHSSPPLGPTWDVTRDGRRFLMIEGERPQYINVVLHWFEELKAKVPTR